MSSEKNSDDEKYNPEVSPLEIDNKAKDADKGTVDSLASLVDNLSLEGDHGKVPEERRKHESDKQYEIKNTITIPDWLKDCETPFSWHLEQERGLGVELVILRTLEKLDELLIEEPEFSLQRFVSLLKLVLEYYLIGDIDKCCENMKTIEGCLEEEISRNEPMYLKVKLSLGHVVSATKAHVLYITGQEEESKQIGQCIIPVKIMADPDKAAINSMKARFFLYSGYENGEAVAVEYARKALELEPESAEWEYLLAKVLRQQRRLVPFSTEVPRDELKLLESAVQRNKDPKYLVYLAQVYRECSSQAFKRYKSYPNFDSGMRSTVEQMAEKALEYYKDAFDMSPESPAVLRRVGYGIMNLPRKFADYDLALKCLLESLKISENQVTLHMLGTFYSRYRNDNRKALEYFEKTAVSGSLFGLMDMIKMKWILNRDYDPRPDLEIGLGWKMKKSYHNQVLAQLVGYYLFIKRDFFKAAEYFKEMMLTDKDSRHMKNFKSFFLQMKEPIDLYGYMANEALIHLQTKKCDKTTTPETDEQEVAVDSIPERFAEEFLELISEVRPEVKQLTPNPELLSRLIESSRKIAANNRGRGNFRGQRGYRGRERGYHGNRGGSEGQDNERRGRFSYANQREGRPEGEQRRGYGRRGGRGNDRGNNKNWRQRPRSGEED